MIEPNYQINVFCQADSHPSRKVRVIAFSRVDSAWSVSPYFIEAGPTGAVDGMTGDDLATPALQLIENGQQTAPLGLASATHLTKRLSNSALEHRRLRVQMRCDLCGLDVTRRFDKRLMDTLSRLGAAGESVDYWSTGDSVDPTLVFTVSLAGLAAILT